MLMWRATSSPLFLASLTFLADNAIVFFPVCHCFFCQSTSSWSNSAALLTEEGHQCCVLHQASIAMLDVRFGMVRANFLFCFLGTIQLFIQQLKHVCQTAVAELWVWSSTQEARWDWKPDCFPDEQPQNHTKTHEQLTGHPFQRSRNGPTCPSCSSWRITKLDAPWFVTWLFDNLGREGGEVTTPAHGIIDTMHQAPSNAAALPQWQQHQLATQPPMGDNPCLWHCWKQTKSIQLITSQRTTPLKLFPPASLFAPLQQLVRSKSIIWNVLVGLVSASLMPGGERQT